MILLFIKLLIIIILLSYIHCFEFIYNNIGIIIILLSISYIVITPYYRESTTLLHIIEVIILFSIFLSITLFDNLLALFITLELISICIYTYVYPVYIGDKKRYNYENSHNIITYYIINSLGSLLFLYSIYNIYKGYGDIRISNIIYTMGAATPAQARDLIGAALLIKLGAGPFFFWKIELYNKLETSKLLFLSVVPNILYYYLLFLFIYNNLSISNNLLVIFITISIIYSIFGYFSSPKYNLLLLYSSIYNIALLLTNLLIYNHIQYNYDISFFCIIYMINLIGFIHILYITNKERYKHYRPIILLYIFSFIGFPPLGGFFGKIYIIYYSILSNTNILIYIMIIILLSTIIIAPLYIKLLSYYYFPSERSETRNEIYITMNTNIYNIISISTIINIYIIFIVGYYPF